MPEKILIIEDEIAIAELERDYLERAGYKVEIAQDGETGLDRALAEPFDMYILDLLLPEGDGFEICRRIREARQVPILIISAKKDDIDKIKGLGLGADDYMTKPFSPSEMVARVRAHLGRYMSLTRGATGDVIEIRGIRLDRASRRVWVQGEEKTFTGKEFDLLAFFMSHADRVYSKEELFREIWGMESVGEIATVTVHVKRLREKIETDPDGPKNIETIWGVGYRFRS